ncbi:acyl carrier protein [Chromohalobacter salexigens]|nr:acyl carrier protein [Chromohalobacter salexigens]
MKKIKDILLDVFGIQESEIDDGKGLEDLGFDSISTIELQAEIERAFNLQAGSLKPHPNDNLDSILKSVQEVEKNA